MTNERKLADDSPPPDDPGEPRGEPTIWADSESGGQDAPPPPADPDPEPGTDLDTKLAPDTWSDKVIEAETRDDTGDPGDGPPPEDPPPVTDVTP